MTIDRRITLIARDPGSFSSMRFRFLRLAIERGVYQHHQEVERVIPMPVRRNA